MITKYRKKPVVVEALEWTGENMAEISKFSGELWKCKDGCLLVPTLEGDMKASKGDYIIKGVKGECYPCKPDIFKETYEEVEKRED